MAFDLDDEENEATRIANGASKKCKDKNINIKVGGYVRTKDGKIDKVINSNFYMGIYVECEKGLYLIKNMVKHSKQLIDLIKVGDIVNECVVVGFGHECVNGNNQKSILVGGTYTKINYALLDFDIETILTKEQFEANCYKVGGEDE